MYKVFYNQRTVFFVEQDFNIDQNDSDTVIFKDRNLLKKDINVFLKKEKRNILHVVCEDVDFAFSEFTKLYHVIEAAGGLVRNKKDEVLLIFRRNKWDLPKGKIEENEEPQNAALREVQEECGIQNIDLGGILKITYHTYELDGNKILKRNYWYNMCVSGKQKPKPQVEEEITEVKWFKTNNLEEVIENTFPSIIDVFEQAEII